MMTAPHKSDKLEKPEKSKSKYVSKKPDSEGYVDYTDLEHQTWNTLITRQLPVVANRACDEFLHGLDVLKFTKDTIPQLPDVNKNLHNATGWQVAPVPALINFDKFFNLLANKKFPALLLLGSQKSWIIFKSLIFFMSYLVIVPC